ncbi:MAG: ABC transporter permease subunit, partial [Cyclobacteriaceae bacterium]|nr:ABC transporter permease subunit [Cyclobacteriaceae bacterium]
FGLGGTMICFEALRQGEIDLYPEYTGTGLTAILNRNIEGKDARETFVEVRQAFDSEFNLTWLEPLGFSNKYALVIRDTFKISRISELDKLGGRIRLGFSHEFLNRPDGYTGLSEHYGLRGMNVRGMEHGLVYMAIEQGEIDVTDAYETDGKPERYDLKMLEDDRDFFPPYEAAIVVSNRILDSLPGLKQKLSQLSGEISTQEMRDLNYRVEVMGESIPSVAGSFLTGEGWIENSGIDMDNGLSSMLARQTLRHIFLTLMATFMAVLVGIPLGIFITRKRKMAGIILGFANIVQTIPSLAILGFMIPLFGIGLKPAIAALFLYGLLPIVRNTHTGIITIDRQLIESGTSMGLKNWQLLHMLELPLATGVIMAGIRTSLVINIGTATLAAFIGAGGLGDFIITGITLNDHKLIMKGAVPAAILALTADFILGKLEKKIQPRGLGV